ncbi:protein kinase C delta type-like isoform X1 [Pelobates fuscus]|uniref:protein kinase C delta type-like isoform X1 n=3 Tax=Pelobates fuscus TaxID=191477 RepID=UPI002FE43382
MRRLCMILHLKMKCFSRYLPYIFRPPNTILSSSCHTEGTDHQRVMMASWRSRKPVAVKIMRKDAIRADIILRERRVLEIARNCPFLCEGLAAFQTKMHTFFVMPYMFGGSLDWYLTIKRSLPTYEAMFYAAEITCGLQFLHKRGIVHRDIKPDNIMLDEEGHARICDFGLVAENITGGVLAQGSTGTTTHMAPEVAAERRYGASCDWWSLGVTLHQMLTGHLPIYIKLPGHRCSCSKQLRFSPHLSKESKDVMSKLLEESPRLRLGVRSNIRLHPFFGAINWRHLEAKAIPPPYKPQRGPAENPLWNVRKKHFSFMEPMKYHTFSGDSWFIPNLSFTSSKLRDYC